MLVARPGLSAFLALVLGITGSVVLPANDVLALPSYGPDTTAEIEGESAGLIVIAEEATAQSDAVLDEQERLVSEEELANPDLELLEEIDELGGEGVPITDDGGVDIAEVVDEFGDAEPIAEDVWVVDTDADPDELEGLPGVALVEEDFLVLPSAEDPYLTQQWGLHNFGQTVQGTPGIATADVGWRAAQTVVDGSGVVVAVVDSGVELTHPDLAGQLWVNSDETCSNGVDDDANGYVDDCDGFDFINYDGTPFDERTRSGAAVDNNHGTHVAGIIAATTSNGAGIAGVAAGARIMSVKVFENGSSSISTIIQGIDYASSNGAQIINLSLGSSPGTPFSQALYDAVARAQARGSLVVVAAGNSGVDIDRSAVWPASLTNPNLVTVGASTNRDERASFSNYGAVGVDLYAPGQAIVSSIGGGGYAFYNGTSMATPMVSGVAALVVQASGVRDPVQLRGLLLSGVVPVGAFSGISATGGRASAGATLGYAALEPGSVSFTADGLGGWIDGPVDATLVVGSPRAAEQRTDLTMTFGVIVDGSVSAVIGHPLTVAVGGAGGPVTTSPEGSVPLGLSDTARQALSIGTLQIEVSGTLPDGEYVLHLGGTTGDGAQLAGQMVRFRVGTEPEAPSGPGAGPGSGGSTGGGTGSAPDVGSGGGGGGGPAPVGGGGGSAPDAGPGGDGGGGSAPGGGTSSGGGASVPPGASPGGGSSSGGGSGPGGGSSSGGGSGPGGGSVPGGGGTSGGGSTGGGPAPGGGGAGSVPGGGTTPAAPVGVSPSAGPVSGGTLVRIDGSFTAVESVSFGGSFSPFVFVSPSYLLAESPRRVAGTVDIVVRHAGGETVFRGAFTFVDPAASGSVGGGGSTGGAASGGGSSGGGGAASGGSASGGGSADGGGSAPGGGSAGGGGGSAGGQPSVPATTTTTMAVTTTTTTPATPPARMLGAPRSLDNGLTVDRFGPGHPLGGSVSGSACRADDCRSFRP